jgi:hypothetical protein
MKNLATIQKIIDIKPIEGADAVELAFVLGWQVVVKKGEFKVGDIEYTYFIDSIDSPYGGESDFYSIAFDEKYNTSKNIPTGNAKENYIKILSTMYKIILNFTQSQKPEYIGIASMDNMGSKNYHTIYANLTDNKSNRIPGYFRKDVNLPFNTPQGKGRMVVLKRKDV